MPLWLGTKHKNGERKPAAAATVIIHSNFIIFFVELTFPHAPQRVAQYNENNAQNEAKRNKNGKTNDFLLANVNIQFD